jgi:hypothetical protein
MLPHRDMNARRVYSVEMAGKTPEELRLKPRPARFDGFLS